MQEHRKEKIAEELKIARSFKNSLMADLPDHLKDLRSSFGSLPRLDWEVQGVAYDRNEMAIKNASQPYSDMLNEYALRPIDIFDFISGLDYLFARFKRRSENLAEAVILINRKLKRFNIGSLHKAAVEVIVDQLFSRNPVQKYEDEHGQTVLDWLVGVLAYKPLLFNRFQAVYVGDDIRLDLEKKSSENCFERWKVTNKTAV